MAGLSDTLYSPRLPSRSFSLLPAEERLVIYLRRRGFRVFWDGLSPGSNTKLRPYTPSGTACQGGRRAVLVARLDARAWTRLNAEWAAPASQAFCRVLSRLTERYRGPLRHPTYERTNADMRVSWSGSEGCNVTLGRAAGRAQCSEAGARARSLPWKVSLGRRSQGAINGIDAFAREVSRSRGPGRTPSGPRTLWPEEEALRMLIRVINFS
ncbi:hypothetical protein C8Q77DRAFT_1136064 [Trametes polyzona]|nr:hypothetical protein C8Q77DRAFT_1136064 [Trametes polyzona]